MSKNPHIAVLIMAKNEKKRLHVTLNSIKHVADSLIFFDTGSEDDTISIAENFCSENNITFRLAESNFKNFSTSRNESLDFADTFDDIDYLLLLDTNDELRGGDTLKTVSKQYINEKNTAFLICQEWWSGQYDKYFNIRLIKPRQGWRYRGRVHEWLKNTKYKDDEEQNKAGEFVIKLENELVLFQDRTQDDDKTGKRFHRDKQLLLEDHLEDPDDARTVFYLAQTCSCLGEHEESFKYYEIRSKMDNGFWEEKYHSYFRCGEISYNIDKNWDKSLPFYFAAFECQNRVEPLIKIIEYYKDKNWLLCYTFADLACKLMFPECLLFVDKIAYDYKRWHLLGIAGWYAGEYENGKIGVLKALESGMGQEVDKFNLKFYTDREKEQENLQTQNNVENLLEKIKEDNPSLPRKQLNNQLTKVLKNK
jgi:glycosyltransferase involved in cell wall biosynthesis|uniref:Glycosyltransferase 2-like domain-containing protein n=1 Tax=viral metagenome TaxID=1070528 RepID=A0A6C0IZ29_9ZZZZ